MGRVDSFCSDDGAVIFYRVIGEGDPVILVHGFGMNNTHWIPFIFSLRGKYQFIIPDLRGFGLSISSYGHYDDVLARHAMDIDCLKTSLGIDKFTLVGYSLGGLSSLSYLQMYGDYSLKNLVLIDIMPKLSASEDWAWSIFGHAGESRMAIWRRLAKRLHREIGHAAFESVDFNDLTPTSRLLLARTLGSFFSDAAGKDWASKVISKMTCYRSLMDIIYPMKYWNVFFDHAMSFINNDYDFRPAIRNSSVPTSIISAANSQVFPYDAQLNMAKEFPNAEVHTLMKSGHMMMLDEPFRFFSIIRSSLEKNKI
jgi:pimeloyl-ACP methyl ester carboxylesterase